jgi:ubiquinone/menaquinone biosynthesis C-methylase UbiE
MTQSWDAKQYGQNAAFVHGLAGGVVEWLAAKPGERILDLGCGDGQLSLQIQATGAIVTGVDASESMVAAARGRGIKAEHSNVEKLPFESHSFDAVFSNAVLHWVKNHDTMLAEVRRVLRPGGRFVAEFGGHGNVAAIMVALRAVLNRHGFGNLEDGVNYYPSVETYRARLEQHGFQVEQIQLIPRPTLLPESGMDGWLRTFRRGVLDALPAELREKVVDETIELLSHVLRDESGQWTADYVRLRFAAITT